MKFLDEVNKLPDPSVLPAGVGYSVAFSPDGKYLVVGSSSSPFMLIYKRDGDTFTKLPNPSVLPTSDAFSVAFSPNGLYLVIGHAISPFLTIYKQDGDTFNKLPNPSVLPTGVGNGVAFSPNGQYLAVGHINSPFLTIYKRDGDTFTKLPNPSVLPTGAGNGVAFSPNGQYLAIGHNESPFLTIYKQEGDSFSKLLDPSILPTRYGRGTTFSPDGQYLAVSHYNSPFLTIYKQDGDTFNKLPNPSILPVGVGHAQNVAFSPDGQQLSIAHDGSPFITIYKRDGDTFTKLPNPPVLPPRAGNGLCYSPGGQYLTIIHYNIPFISIYKRELIFEKKALIYHEDVYKTYSDSWIPVLSDPQGSDYLTFGIDDLSTIPETAWSELNGDVELCFYTDDPSTTVVNFNIETTPFTLAEEWKEQEINVIEYTDDPESTESSIVLETEPFTIYDELGDSVDVLYYTDDPTVNAPQLEITANYSPLDEIKDDFEIITWSDTSNDLSLAVQATPKPQLILQTEEFIIHGEAQKAILNGKIKSGVFRTIMSFNHGLSWEAFRYGEWIGVEPNVEDVLTNGMRRYDVDTITDTAFREKGKSICFGYLLADNIHSSEHVVIEDVKLQINAPTGTAQFGNIAFYILNTTATIQVSIAGNKLTGSISDEDLGKVQYRVLLNGSQYFPTNGQYTDLATSPHAINLNISDRDILFGVENKIKVEFRDSWGHVDYWESTFVGTYSGIMFMDEGKTFLTDSFGGIIKYLDFGIVIAGQTTLEKKVIVKNQLGKRVQNLLLEINKEKLPEGVKIEISKSNMPFISEDPLLFNQFFNDDQEFEFYVRIVTQLGARPAPNGTFELRAKADEV